MGNTQPQPQRISQRPMRPRVRNPSHRDQLRNQLRQEIREQIKEEIRQYMPTVQPLQQEQKPALRSYGEMPLRNNDMIMQHNINNMNITNVNDKIQEFDNQEKIMEENFEKELALRRQKFEEGRKKRRTSLEREIKNFEKSHNDPYKILGLSPNDITTDKIKKAYKIQAQKHHPDKGGNAEIFKKITQSYCYLMNKYGKDLDHERKLIQPVTKQTYNSNMNEGYANVYIDKDNFNINRFNEIFNKFRVEDVYDKGYSDESIFDDNKLNVDIYNKTFENEEKQDIMVYNEPAPLMSGGNQYRELGKDHISDFGGKSEGLQYMDYRKAYHPKTKFIDPKKVEYKKYNNLNELKKERSNISFKLSAEDEEKMRLKEMREKELEEKRRLRVMEDDERYQRQFDQLNRLLIKN